MVKQIRREDGYNIQATMTTASEVQAAKRTGAIHLYGVRYLFTPAQWDQFNKEKEGQS